MCVPSSIEPYLQMKELQKIIPITTDYFLSQGFLSVLSGICMKVNHGNKAANEEVYIQSHEPLALTLKVPVTVVDALRHFETG